MSVTVYLGIPIYYEGQEQVYYCSVGGTLYENATLSGLKAKLDSLLGTTTPPPDPIPDPVPIPVPDPVTPTPVVTTVTLSVHNSSVEVGFDFYVSGYVRDQDGNGMIKTVSIYANTMLLGTVNSISSGYYIKKLNLATAGTYTIKAMVGTKMGAGTVTITSPYIPPPPADNVPEPWIYRDVTVEWNEGLSQWVFYGPVDGAQYARSTVAAVKSTIDILLGGTTTPQPGETPPDWVQVGTYRDIPIFYRAWGYDNYGVVQDDLLMATVETKSKWVVNNNTTSLYAWIDTQLGTPPPMVSSIYIITINPPGSQAPGVIFSITGTVTDREGAVLAAGEATVSILRANGSIYQTQKTPVINGFYSLDTAFLADSGYYTVKVSVGTDYATVDLVGLTPTGEEPPVPDNGDEIPVIKAANIIVPALVFLSAIGGYWYLTKRKK